MNTTTCETPKLIRLNDVPNLDWLPERRAGKRLSLATVYRWAQRGLRGRRLQTLRVGGTLATSEEWLVEFFRSLSDDAPAVQPRTPARRKREIEAAARRLEAAGF